MDSSNTIIFTDNHIEYRVCLQDNNLKIDATKLLYNKYRKWEYVLTNNIESTTHPKLVELEYSPSQIFDFFVDHSREIKIYPNIKIVFTSHLYLVEKEPLEPYFVHIHTYIFPQDIYYRGVHNLSMRPIKISPLDEFLVMSSYLQTQIHSTQKLISEFDQNYNITEVVKQRDDFLNIYHQMEKISDTNREMTNRVKELLN